MPRLPPLPRLESDAEGTLTAPDFDDTYFSRDGGLAETRLVFLQGCGLPERWAGRDRFTVAELGLGTGLNVLALWDLWRRHRPSPRAILHMVTVEGFLMDAAIARTSLQASAPELGDLAERLLARWPVRTSGLQRIWFEEDGFALTVVVGEAGTWLPQLSLQADAWFLDGFAPARNPLMWSAQVLGEVRRLCAPGARAATYSVAGPVRRALQELGFTLARPPGFGRKRERLEASRPAEPSQPQDCTPPASALVIGGGIAGAAAARALVRRGLAVQVLDADTCGQTKASGNPAALVMPRLDRDATREGRFHRQAFVLAAAELARLGPPALQATGVVETARSDRDLARAADLLADPPLPHDWLCDDGQGRLLHRRGGMIAPVDVVDGLLAGIDRLSVTVAQLVRRDGCWVALDAAGTVLASADLCVVAAGPAAPGLLASAGADDLLPLEGRHGTLSIAPLAAAMAPPDPPLAGGAYAGPFRDGLFFGATFDPWPLDRPPQLPDSAEHRRNQALLDRQAPDLAAALELDEAWGRAAVRVTAPDRMPVAGPMAGAGGLFVLAGLGARGFTTAFLCAELIAAQALGEPLPVETDVAEALDPARFARRARQRAQAQ